MKRILFPAIVLIVFIISTFLSQHVSATTTLVLFPTDDAHTFSSEDTTNFGAVSELSVVKTRAYEYISFLKFNTSALDPDSIVAAVLKLNVLDGSDDTQQLHQVSNNSWSEATISHSTRPELSQSISTMTGYPDDSWVEFDVTNQVKASTGSVSYALSNSGSDDLILASKEYPQNNPQLIIVTNQTDAVPNTDVNSDGITDYSDYTDLVEVFGNHGCDVNADVNRNCQVDIFDFAIVVSQIN